MSIKSDRWIREMALEQGMIDPFVDRQMRSGVISYGLSSYGYDMRVTDEFKVFTNVFNVLVDPKQFSPRSFVDIQAVYCDIPPNSFALARSVEYFRIPRNVSCIVMGKSTYARCFRGDTLVALVDGTSLSLEELARRTENGEEFWGYSVTADGHIIESKLEQPRYIGRDPLVKVLIDNGEDIYCTPDHEFLLHNGSRQHAESLRTHDALLSRHQQHHRPVKVVNVATVSGEHDVYCLTVPATGNFALAAGVFVSNCGIIVNVTPLEPEWEGHVTIEISNTTPLPARIYANEGIGQVLFFESDEACEVSYADKQGKYQQQHGIVLPKIDAS